ncbi:MAG: hypothetical protein KA151_03200 [Piscinibacter sp.]|nr:hypothetical protein [Piscinibacter sp.]
MTPAQLEALMEWVRACVRYEIAKATSDYSGSEDYVERQAERALHALFSAREAA